MGEPKRSPVWQAADRYAANRTIKAVGGWENREFVARSAVRSCEAKVRMHACMHAESRCVHVHIGCA